MVEIAVIRKGTAEYSVQLSTSVFKGKLTSPHMFIAIDPEADIKYTANSLRGDDIHNLADILETINREFGTCDSVSIFHYMGDTGSSLMANQSLELLSAEKKKHGVVWLRYKVHQ